ncbi:ethylbenzene dehydrogenase-related protein [Motiliproteus sp. SC1-56]|uniref:ethylbenzene dehydrogenase-related protein n=1 Tax=Motiliproteus sp. SC1-56 TaxID=2799565 RepID=UPI001A904217|nr:ethylbenzene dehydrogenase-related protein [Motiliproteus sp. SC1-56]
MTSRLLSPLAALLISLPVLGATPKDTYFALAVTENSHNHGGSNLLFLDFQEQFERASDDKTQRVASPRLNNTKIQLDAKLDEWPEAQFTTVQSRVMNNYPLSEYYDVVPVPIQIASAHDDEYLYFALRFTDANHDASINRNRWIKDATGWRPQPHTLPNPGAPTASAVNRGDRLLGNESEDRVFLMFPIVDQQGNFRDGGHGCAGYCHSNLVESPPPGEGTIGAEVAAMHTALPGDRADIWHWTSTRSAPAQTLKDAHLIYGPGSENGRKADPGQSPDVDNDRASLQFDAATEPGPAYISRREFEAGLYQRLSHSTTQLREGGTLRIEPEMDFALGVSLPYSIHRPSSGSRADVTVVSRFDPTTNLWTLEMRRRLDTGDPEHDHIFTAGTASLPPRAELIRPGSPEQGAKLFEEKGCVHCHGEEGEGVFEAGAWKFPRIQRASGPLIFKTADPHRPKRLRSLAYRRGENVEMPAALMPTIPLTAQQAEDIASWLQDQFTPLGR